MSQFCENLRTDGRTDPSLQDPSGRGRGSNKRIKKSGIHVLNIEIITVLRRKIYIFRLVKLENDGTISIEMKELQAIAFSALGSFVKLLVLVWVKIEFVNTKINCDNLQKLCSKYFWCSSVSTLLTFFREMTASNNLLIDFAVDGKILCCTICRPYLIAC